MAGNITIMTFGYGYGGPGPGFAHVANVRNVPAAREATPENNGTDPKIHNAVMATTAAKAWLEKMKKWSLKDGDKVAIGCARGHHRSVAIAQEYAKYLRSQDWTVTVKNRDISKKYSRANDLINLLSADIDNLGRACGGMVNSSQEPKML